MKKIALCGVLTALALALSVAEWWIKLSIIIPAPGIKLGLANIITVFALKKIGPKEASAILFSRIVLASIFAGSIISFLFSLMGGYLALLIMWILFKYENYFSILGVCIAGAAMHNIGQICAAIIVLKSINIIAYLPVLLIAAIPLGFATGSLSKIVLFTLDKVKK